MSRNASRSSGTPFPVQVESSDPSTQGSPTQSIRNKTLLISNYREASKASSRSRDQAEKLKLDSAGKLLLWCIYIHSKLHNIAIARTIYVSFHSTVHLM